MRRSANCATAPASTASASRPPITPAASFSREARSERSTFPRTARSISTRRLRAGRGSRSSPRSPRSFEGGDVLRELVRRRDAGGLKVSLLDCLPSQHPARHAPSGSGHAKRLRRSQLLQSLPIEPGRARLCRALWSQDLTHSYEPDLVELESPSFMGFAHEFHHEKDGVGLTAEDDFALSLCFCDSCLAARHKGRRRRRSRAPHRRAMDRRGLRTGSAEAALP